LARREVRELLVLGVNNEGALEDEVKVVARITFDEEQSARRNIERFCVTAKGPERSARLGTEHGAIAQGVLGACHVDRSVGGGSLVVFTWDFMGALE
jgi:hypothetical protein